MSYCGSSLWLQCNLSRPHERQILCILCGCLLLFTVQCWPKTTFLLLACYVDWLEESKSSDHMQTGWTRWSRSILTVTGYERCLASSEQESCLASRCFYFLQLGLSVLRRCVFKPSSTNQKLASLIYSNTRSFSAVVAKIHSIQSCFFDFLKRKRIFSKCVF